MADKPSRGLADVVAASTAISDIDGRHGRLFYRGYDIHDLAGSISFEECIHLLQRGTLPTRAQLEELKEELRAARQLPPLVEDLLPRVAVRAEPMAAMRTLVSLLGHEDPDKASNSIEANRRKGLRLVAQLPVLVARYHAARSGQEAPPDPDPKLGIAGNFLLQITGKHPDDFEAVSFDECLVLHADHTMNASTFSARVTAATLSDMHSAIVSAIGTLKGPLHGGANEAVMAMLESIPDVDAVEEAVHQRLAGGGKIMGFGHRVYRTEDPRARHLRRMARELGQRHGFDKYYEMSFRMQQAVLDERGLYPNVDFYAASTYHALRIPHDLFTAVFAVSRTAGWTSHVMEQHADNRLIRPDSEYIGLRNQTFVPLDERG
ncbi:MAG TPA: citrate/2-methylcitrate synthase [Mycobacteriales bacterium]|nr:citrate/2-methylcitrate synthase [Mycobacteriales bacterium]